MIDISELKAQPPVDAAENGHGAARADAAPSRATLRSPAAPQSSAALASPAAPVSARIQPGPGADPDAFDASGDFEDLEPAEFRAPQDLLSSLSDLLAENARLERLSHELRPAAVQDDEFGRFARQAIPIIDALDRIIELGLEHADSDELSGWLQSVQSLYERIVRVFDGHDLHIMNCLGQKVDFSLHDVIEYRRTREYPHNTVIQEIRKGIVFRGRVMRDAKVVIACNEEQADPEELASASDGDSQG